MPGLFGAAPEEVAVRLKHGIGFDERVKVLQRGEVARERAVRLPDEHVRLHQRGHGGIGRLVFRVAGERELGHQHQTLVDGAKLLKQRHNGAELGGGIAAFRTDNVRKGPDAPGEGRKVGGKGRIVKAGVKHRKIPGFLHHHILHWMIVCACHG